MKTISTTAEFYSYLANCLQALESCNKDKAKFCDAIHSHEENIQKLIAMLPHGSGIDSDYHISSISYNRKKDLLSFSNCFSCMDENGFYDKYVDFTVFVSSSLITGLTIEIIGNFGKKYYDIKDYLEQTYIDFIY